MKQIILLFFVVIFPVMAKAYDACINGIYFNINKTAKTAEVTYLYYANSRNQNAYSDVVNIPTTIDYDGDIYDVTSIGDYAFDNCIALTSVTIPNSVTSIGDWIFAYCSALTSVTIPSSVTSIGEHAFFNCTALTSVIIPRNVTNIGESAFSHCSALTSVTIGNGITSISDNAFYGCSKLTSVTIPNSVTNIGGRAFSDCSALTSVTIPSSVTTIGNFAFAKCSALTTVTIPSSVTSIEYGVFHFCFGLTSVTIPNSVKSIGEAAFYGCSTLTSIIIPNSVTNIGETAFYGCSSLSSVTIGSGVKDICSKAFASCFKITNVYCLSDNVPRTSLDAFQDSPIQYATLHLPESAINNYTTEPWNSFKRIVSLSGISYYTLTYMIDNEVYKTYKLAVGGTITPEPEPKKEGYTFSGWSTIPNTMPAYDVIVYGTFVLNKKTYTLTISATGNGFALYNGITIRSNTNSFTVDEGTNAAITFSPDNGYRIKSVKVGSTDVTTNVVNNRYTVSNIQANRTIYVVFEAIPPTTYSLTISSTGNGYASYNGTTIRNKTSTFTVNEGTNAVITFSPDDGYRIKSVKVGNTDVTTHLSNNRYTVSNIQNNTSVSVVFEAIPPTTYSLTISAIGNGYASYNGTTIRSKTSSFTVDEGTNATISFSPDDGYRIRIVRDSNTDVTTNVVNNRYTVSNIQANRTVSVVFEAIPIATYSLSISSTGYGTASYNSTPIRNSTSTFTVNEGTNATITFNPDNGYRIKSVKVGSSDVTATVSNNSYSVSNIQANTTVSVVFEAIPTTTYLLYISATGNGSASYNSTTIRNKTTSFTVNEGTNATISFSPDNGYRIKSVTVGSTDVTASVTNNRYTVSNIKNNTIVGIEFEANNTYTPGDVNNDGSVSVTDVGCAINYILEQIPEVFVFEAADMNGDNSVSVTDVGMIINLILNEEAGSRENGKSMEANDHNVHINNVPNISLEPTAGSYLELMLEDKDVFIGFQFDVEDAEGAGWHGVCPYISLQLSDGDDHVLTSRQLSNGKWRVVCYSPSNSTFSSNSGGPLLTINTERIISLSDLRLTTAGLEELRPAAIVSTPTGIYNVEHGMKINAEGGTLRIISDRDTTLRLYSLGGSAYRTLPIRKGVNSFDGLRAGLYMINNQKIILR